MASFSILVGYLAGSVPFAFLLARRAGIDVRRVGSRNVGAANVLRNTGIGRALLVMVLDVAKGAAAVGLALCVDRRQRCGGADRRRGGRRAHLSRCGCAFTAGKASRLPPASSRC